MKIIIDNMSISEFKAWSGATYTQNIIIEKGLCDEFDQLIEECYTDGIGETELNDLLWFDDQWIFESLGISEEEEEEEEEE